MNNLDLVSFICLILFFIFIKVIMRKPVKVRDTFLKVQLLIVLIYNIGIIIVFPYKVPVEFSTLSYFLVPIIVLFNIKELRIWAVYTALLSGVIYYISMILYGTTLYGHFPVYSVVTSLFNHGSLLAYALVSLGNYEFKKSESKIIRFGLLLNAGWALSIRQLVLHPGRIFIYEILDGWIVTTFFPNMLYVFYPIYYVSLVYVLFMSPKVIFGLRRLLQPKTTQIQEEYSPV